MDTSKLAVNTRSVWEVVSTQTALAGFVLIGGTALTMRIAHRISEDLDLISHAAPLPVGALKGFVKILEGHGFTVERDDETAAYDEFLIIGKSLHDYQQNFIVDGVKMNIFVANDDLASLVAPSTEPVVRVATLDELFQTKVLAAANRCASRDWIDLYHLVNHHGFTSSDFFNALTTDAIPNPERKLSQAFQNLCRGIAPAADPGYESLMDNPPSVAVIADYFSAMRDEYEAALTARAIQAAQRSGRSV